MHEYWRICYAKNKERIRQRLWPKQNQIIVRFGARVKESGKLDMSLVSNTLWNTEGQDLKILKS